MFYERRHGCVSSNRRRTARCQPREMSRRSIFLILCPLALLLTTHRLPAPIQEIPESPTPAATPAPEQSAKPKVKHAAKPKAASENSEASTKRQSSSPPPRNQPTLNQDPFNGTWIGVLNNLPFAGNVEFTLFISASGTAVTEKSNLGTNNFEANCDGSTMRWETGSSWTLTPNPDGKTALVTCNSGGFFGVGAFSLSTVFRKTTLSQATVPSVPAEQNRLPVAKPDPNRPGFVYNPYDPTANRLLDVRGKASGTKVKDPISGKLFIVP
jgi:cytoskeletal protein RodZ